MKFYLLNAIQKLRTPLTDDIMVSITRLGDGGILWIVASALLMCFKKTRRAGMTALLALLIGTVVFTLIIKNIICRERPYTFEGAMLNQSSLLIPPPSDYSFPSGHSMASFAAATAIFLNNRLLGTVAFVIASLISFSRLYLYVHFPSDVVCGVIFGILTGILANFITARF